MDKTKELGDQFQEALKDMVEGLQVNIPDVGIYIWSFNEDDKTKNTQHTIISSNVFDKLGNDKSVCEWIYDAVNGNVQTFGLELLDWHHKSWLGCQKSSPVKIGVFSGTI